MKPNPRNIAFAVYFVFIAFFILPILTRGVSVTLALINADIVLGISLAIFAAFMLAFSVKFFIDTIKTINAYPK